MWLGEAEVKGGLHVAQVESVSSHELIEERIEVAPPSTDAAELIGRSLARTHAEGAEWYGANPAGFRGNGYIIGDTLTPVVRSEDRISYERWGSYFARVRVRPFVSELLRRDIFAERDIRVFKVVCARLEAGEFDMPEPALVTTPASRLHGDLWAGNLLYDANPKNASRGALIDPMAHGGHAETDLAMLALFGFPYFDRLLAAYNEISLLAEGWRERVGLHQLPPLLHHCLLFGRSYYKQTLATAARYA